VAGSNTIRLYVGDKAIASKEIMVNLKPVLELGSPEYDLRYPIGGVLGITILYHSRYGCCDLDIEVSFAGDTSVNVGEDAIEIKISRIAMPSRHLVFILSLCAIIGMAV